MSQLCFVVVELCWEGEDIFLLMMFCNDLMCGRVLNDKVLFFKDSILV